MTEKPKAKCGCGRSPTGYCVGWHSLSEEDYLQKKDEYEASEKQSEEDQDIDIKQDTKFSQEQEQKIKMTMDANPGASREDVIKALQKANQL